MPTVPNVTITPDEINPNVTNIEMDGEIIGDVLDEGGAIPTRGRYAARSSKAGGNGIVGFYANPAEAVAAVIMLFAPEEVKPLTGRMIRYLTAGRNNKDGIFAYNLGGYRHRGTPGGSSGALLRRGLIELKDGVYRYTETGRWLAHALARVSRFC